MPTDNVAEFPGTPIRGAGFDYEVHWTLSEALRESARQGFERKLKGLWARYASPRWKEHPFGRPDFLDSALLVAREQHYFEGRTWRDSFRYVVQIVTSKPECERIEGICMDTGVPNRVQR